MFKRGIPNFVTSLILVIIKSAYLKKNNINKLTPIVSY